MPGVPHRARRQIGQIGQTQRKASILIGLCPGDGIGPEVIGEAGRLLAAAGARDLVFETAEVGGAAYKASGHPLPQATLDVARRADAILFGAVGDPDCDRLERHLRPEQAILGLRKELGLFANLRSEEHTSELQSLMRISYAVFCLKKKKLTKTHYLLKHNKPSQST